jgi:hypothetical protein
MRRLQEFGLLPRGPPEEVASARLPPAVAAAAWPWPRGDPSPLLAEQLPFEVALQVRRRPALWRAERERLSWGCGVWGVHG